MKKLRIHYFQHVPYEGLGNIEEWITAAGHSLTSTRFYETGQIPETAKIDWLIIMGGPMNVNDEKQYPWLKPEKKFIREAIDAGKIVLGICLGSQLISASLGANVYKSNEPEIGWFDIKATGYAKTGAAGILPEGRTKVFHWHGDTFDLPVNAIHLAFSKACRNQAYIYNEKVLALQFHIEPTADMIHSWIEVAGDIPGTGYFIQSKKEIMDNLKLIERNKKVLFNLLSILSEKA